jgi:predicted PhzF superfamily epimerase YddE/YHI9
LNQVHIHQGDVFTDKKFGGNPAGVVLDAEKLDETVMCKITRELTYNISFPREIGSRTLRCWALSWNFSMR